MAYLGQIVTDAQSLIGEVAGPGVQVFSEERTLKDAIRAFNMLFTKYNWEQYMVWFRSELNGTTGILIDADFNSVRDFSDIRSVHRDGEEDTISMLPAMFNPYTLSQGTRPMFFTSLPASHTDYLTKMLKFYPPSAVGHINVHARVYPAVPLTLDSEVFLDQDLLTFATAFMGLALDDLNASATEVCKGFMDMRYKDILAALAGHAVSTGGGVSPLSDWTQVP